MSKLIEYAQSSSIMEIKIKYNDQLFKFNLDTELKVQESSIATHLKNQPRGYAFLAMLHKKMVIKVRDASKHYTREKFKKLSVIKPKYDTLKEAESHLSQDLGLQKLEREILEYEEARDVLEVAVRAFEMRKDLIQTLSANIRKERL